ncbi:4-diphosphocytidyl-2-C-methyl-D-erythritol kinase [Bosea sp. 62]|uniref:4-(cytidine 5'-diphospho)-2-C-methyl-D-erythritol kinase n=1 Tax=unclassified Bosea (in: a-proteobacteria) TaxID=2653178 RepID=UPI001258BE58|nr:MULTISPECIES: 4-(cytidine 5'-diphospho)-2-C-methyl-D-erythritol kinase [unclassified Bosea (in: a-proteobacteria)]CAD5293562.1 4-diphosphocytidyl-2-C-methyl-D-erythritol kinase [Bosea sp. 7B]CAD5298414.1 4-diphosphocytidyl-2-C-methyl-D-erythritol kinase [Bosea sp. 21B]CAD5298581.1 4-diphosphocytidyl-2-C-methyl-D-erythritol kinase [Bosea sp. 46]VVT61464.1 4-diphosphocytidyl-2-C-methyl-D-erythritol kinase [Bosea sp. EC-HK365B]VXB13956.1 4-diphosphocytidyl-2-C-methyl-D-erythritol kinase [Bosea
MFARLATRAPAKVNLSLSVLGRRADGYHELDSLVAFAGVGDELSLTPGEAGELQISGPFAAGLSTGPDNLVLKAERVLREEIAGLRSGRFHLVKRLPVASGIGGGSTDAAAALRLLARLNDLPLSHPALLAAAGRIGADVPVCLEARARVMRGVGERLGPVLRLPRLFALLVNPGVAVETAPVFRALGLQSGQGHPGGVEPFQANASAPATSAALITALAATGNDLEAPARVVAPAIGEVLSALSASPGCRLARMSGSGATCFAVFDDCRASAAAAKRLAHGRPDWWLKPTVLR